MTERILRLSVSIAKSGHGAGKPMSKVLEEQADIYGFIMYNLGMNPKF